MAPFFARSAGKGVQAGIEFQPSGIAIAAIQKSAVKPPRIVNTVFHAATESASRSEIVARAVSQQKLKGSRSILVLEPGSYTLLPIEAPNVAANELMSAVRWRVKDMIDFNLSDVTIDLFELPKSRRAGTQKMLTVVIARNELIKRRVEAIRQAGLEIDAIDINELALRNLILLYEKESSEQGAVIYLFLFQKAGIVQVVRQSQVCLTRHIEMDARHMMGMEAGEDTEGVGADSLLLEIQRSADHYTNQFGEAGISKIVMIQGSVMEWHHELMQYVTNNLGMESKVVALQELIGSSENVNLETSDHCLAAIGAALRKQS